MKTVTDRQLAEYRRKNKVNREQAARLLQADRGDYEPNSVDKLVISVSEAVQRTGEMNQQALNLIQRMFQQLALPQATPPAPQIYMPEPAKRWRFVVIRGNDGLIAEVLAERMDDSLMIE